MLHLMHAIKKWKLQTREARERTERGRERDECAFNLKKDYFIPIEIIVQGGTQEGPQTDHFS